ncbi:MAG: hypothetical protein R3E32_19530 [Chitinophagales bacterium]
MRNLTTRLFIILLAIIYLTSPTFAQNEESPVRWTFEYKAVNNSSSEYELRFIANTLPGWYIYSQELESRPPIPTSFVFEKNMNDYMMIGNIEEEGDLIVKFDELFEQDIKKYTDKVIFKSRIVVSGTSSVQVKGHLEYMACDASTCKPPTQVEFLFEIEPDDNTPLITTNEIEDYKVMNSPSYSIMDRINNNGMIINVPEGPIEIRQSNSKKYTETKVDIALTGSENIVNEDKEQIIDEEGGNLLVAANISNYLKKKKKKMAKPTIASRTIQKKEKKNISTSIAKSNPVKWTFDLEKGEKSNYSLVFKADVENEWNLSQNAPILSFDNKQSIVSVEGDMRMEKTNDGKLIFRKTVKFKDNVMLTGKMSYKLTDTDGKVIEREASFAFNQGGDVITYQNKAGWWIGSIVSLSILLLLIIGWKGKETLLHSKDN